MPTLHNKEPSVLLIGLEWRQLGGLEIYNGYLAQAIAAAGCAVELWGTQNWFPVQVGNLRAHPLSPPTQLAQRFYGRFFWRQLLKLRLHSALDEFDLVIVGHVHLLPTVYEILRKKTAQAKPHWVWTYGIEVWRDLPPQVVKALNAAQLVGAISHFTADKIKQRATPASVAVIHNPIDIDKFKPPGHSLSDSSEVNKKILTVGRMSSSERYKGHEVVMQALCILNDKMRTPIVYWIVGDGDDQPRLGAYASKLGVQGQVHFFGRVPEDELIHLYQTSDVFVMPSRVEQRSDGSWTGEGFGFVYIEGAACGLPVVAGNQGGAQEAVCHGETGFAVDPTSPEAVADAVYQVLTDRSLARRMGEAGRRFVEENFSLSNFQRQVAILLRENGF